MPNNKVKDKVERQVKWFYGKENLVPSLPWFNPWASDGGRRERTSTSCHVTSTCILWHVRTHTHTEEINVKLLKNKVSLFPRMTEQAEVPSEVTLEKS